MFNYGTAILYTQAEIKNRINVDPTLDTNFQMSESDCRRTVEMITMYCVGTTQVSNVALYQYW